MTDSNYDLTNLTTQVVASFVRNNRVSADEVPSIIQAIYSAFQNVGEPIRTTQEEQKPSVPIKKSVTPDYIICLEDGKKLKMLKRHLRTTYDMSPEEYRAKWSLPPEYPMTAPNYGRARSVMAIAAGLGRKPAVMAKAEAVVERMARRNPSRNGRVGRRRPPDPNCDPVVPHATGSQFGPVCAGPQPGQVLLVGHSSGSP